MNNEETKCYIMADTETTGLDTRNAVAWQIGMVAFENNYAIDLRFQATSGISPGLWEPSTLDFANKTYGQYVAIAAIMEDYSDYLDMMVRAKEFIEERIGEYGYKNVYLICNHVEFDWPILLNSFTRAGIALPLTGLIHYQNKLDLQSLCRGKAGKKWPEAYAEFKKVSPPVTHLALDDCMSQIAMLEYFGVELP